MRMEGGGGGGEGRGGRGRQRGMRSREGKLDVREAIFIWNDDKHLCMLISFPG